MTLNASKEENSTDELIRELSFPYKVVFMGAWITALLLNLPSFFILLRVAYRKRSWPNVLVLYLNTSDLLVLLAGLIPSAIAMFVDGLLSTYLELCCYQAIVLNTWYVYVFMLVVCISMDRYLAVKHPFYYNKKVMSHESFKRASIVLIPLAFLALLLAFIPAMLGWRYRVVHPGLYCFFDWTSKDAKDLSVAVVNAVFVLIVLALLIFFTGCICVGIHTMVQSARRRVSDLPGQRNSSHSRMEVDFAKLAVIITAVFAACSLPFTVSWDSTRSYVT